MRVYLAGPSRESARVRLAAIAIVDAGHVLTSRWHQRDVPPSDAPVPWEVAAEAWRENTDAIADANCVIALTMTPSGLSQGVREEVAWALGFYRRHGWTRDVIVVGDPGPSLAVTGCIVVPDIASALVLLGKAREALGGT